MSATRQTLTSVKLDKELSADIGILADAEHRTKLGELRFLVKKRMEELKL